MPRSIEGVLVNSKYSRQTLETSNRPKKQLTQVFEKLGKLDIFYQVGGMFAPAPLMMADHDNFDTTFRVNLMGPIMALINGRDHLKDNASVILTTTTISTRPAPGMSSYAASKAGLDMFGKTIALELADRGIRVNIISPGATDTPAYDKIGLPEDQISGFKTILDNGYTAQNHGSFGRYCKCRIILGFR